MSLQSDQAMALAMYDGLTAVEQQNYATLLEAYGFTTDATLDKVSPRGQLALVHMARSDSSIVAGFVELAASRPRRTRGGQPSWTRRLEPGLRVVTQ